MATFDRADTYNKVVDIIIQKLKIEKNTVTPSATLQDLGADSLDMVEIIMKLEEQFGILNKRHHCSLRNFLLTRDLY